MAIKYYPNRIEKKSVPSIDRVMAKRNPLMIRGSYDITAAGLDIVVSADRDWQLNAIAFNFSGAVARDFSAKIMGGRKVVTNLNDYLWFQSDLTLPQQITLDADFYTGTQLATELQTQLNANAAFTADGVTFTVAYVNTTGLFTITPSSGTLRYLNVNTLQTQRYRDSIAGHLFGLNTDSVFGATVVTDTPVFGLDSEAWIIDETASVVTELYFDDLKILDIDQAVHLETSTAAIRVDYSVNYEIMV